MPCDTRLRRGQTITQRKAEVRKSVTQLSKLLVAGTVKPVVGPQGAIAFQGWTDTDRDGVTDAYAYRQLQIACSALALATITRAEQIAGRSVNKQAVAHGAHSHDGGHTWHNHKG